MRSYVWSAVVIGAVLVDAPSALAQLVQSEIDEQPTPDQASQLVTSSTEVRRAVIGLIAIALVVAVLGVLYWRKTGQQARDRHRRRFGGRHRDGTDVIDDAVDASGAPVGAAAAFAAPDPGAPSRLATPGTGYAAPDYVPSAYAAAGHGHGSAGYSAAPAYVSSAGHTGYASPTSLPSTSVFDLSPAPAVARPEPRGPQRSASTGGNPAHHGAAPGTVAPRPPARGNGAATTRREVDAAPATPRRRPAPRTPAGDGRGQRPSQGATEGGTQSPPPTAAASPYPDADLTGSDGRGSESRWSILRRDIFG